MNSIYLLLGVVLAFSVSIQAEEPGVPFERYESYFEKNNDGLKDDPSFLVIKTQEEFNQVFGTARVMGRQRFRPAEAFRSHIVVATIKRGALRTYDEVKLSLDKGTLTVAYHFQDAAPSTATFASPLILSVDIAKREIREVIFVANQQRAGAVRLLD